MKKGKKKERKKKNSTELQKPSLEAEVYNNNKKCDCQKIKLKRLIRFHSANKINIYNRGGKNKIGKKKRNNIQKNLQSKSKHKNNKYSS